MKFRKKQVVIEAHAVRQWDAGETAKWCGGTVIETGEGFIGIEIRTLEGSMLASPGDWVIKGVKGEFYPCKPDIFVATYDIVVDSPAPAAPKNSDGPATAIWSCKIGEAERAALPKGSDGPMRKAVQEAYKALTGVYPSFIFSGWAAELTEGERAAFENRAPASSPKNSGRQHRYLDGEWHNVAHRCPSNTGIGRTFGCLRFDGTQYPDESYRDAPASVPTVMPVAICSWCNGPTHGDDPAIDCPLTRRPATENTRGREETK